MIPSTFLGLVLFAASLGPGYVYLRLAERRSPRAEGSQLEQAVEMVTFGAMFSLVSVMAVLAVATHFNIVDADRVSAQRGEYLISEPIRALGCVLVAFTLAYVLAWVVALVFHHGQPSAHQPGRTVWQDVLWQERPADSAGALVTVEMRNGRHYAGMVKGFTSELSENRELVLEHPAGQMRPDAEMQSLNDRYLILREADVLSIRVRYAKKLSDAERAALEESGDRHPDA